MVTPFEKMWSIITFFLGTFALFVIIVLAYKPVRTSIISPISSFINQYTSHKKFTAASVILKNGKSLQLPDLKALFTDNLRYKSYITQQADEFMALLPDSKERVIKELAMLSYLEKQHASAADIILASEAVVTKPARAWAMDYLWNLRQSGELAQYNINPLDQKNIAWAESQNIDPRMLAIANDIYPTTLLLLKTRPELFFEASETKAKGTTENYIPNPAVIAKLQMMETGWKSENLINEVKDLGFSWNFKQLSKNRAFVNIGSESAWDALNLDESWFPSGHDDLLWIANVLETDSGLPYKKYIESIPGSLRGSTDGSGGAIGPQLMPINARLFMTWYRDANTDLGSVLPTPNPFNPWTGTMLTYLYLSSEFYHRQMNVNNVTDVVRPGYSVLSRADAEMAFTHQDPRIRALRKWNPLDWEATSAVKAGEDYYDLWASTELTAGNIDENTLTLN